MAKFYRIDFKDEEHRKVSDYLSNLSKIENVVVVRSAFCVGYLSKGQGTIILGTSRDITDLSGNVSIDKSFPNSEKIKEDLTKLLKE